MHQNLNLEENALSSESQRKIITAPAIIKHFFTNEIKDNVGRDYKICCWKTIPLEERDNYKKETETFWMSLGRPLPHVTNISTDYKEDNLRVGAILVDFDYDNKPDRLTLFTRKNIPKKDDPKIIEKTELTINSTINIRELTPKDQESLRYDYNTLLDLLFKREAEIK